MPPTDAGASSIAVTVRVRPFTIREAAQLQKTDGGTLFLGDGSMAAAPTPKLNQKGLRSVIKVVDDRCLVFDPPEDNPVHKFSRSVVPTGKKVKDQVFAFDRIFDDNATQADVYEGTTKGLLDCVLDGYNATVFAYGATGCGKTHTITGTAQHPGIIFLTMQELFEKMDERSGEKVTEVTLSYLEIYNETIRDLLVPGGSKQGLMLREDSNHAVTVAGLSSHRPNNVQDVMDMIVQGNECRTVSPTEANAVSSRSHAVLQINVSQKDRNASVNEPHTMATLSIIDLAGSERASATKNRGDRLLEGANINKSLLALGGCINALCDARKTNHVPYRNSKLTRLLKFSLGGNCKTVMIVCVSPSSAHFDETQNTLRYANRAKNIQTKVTRNVFNVNRHVKDFLVKIDEQMALINELKAQQRDAERTYATKARRQLEKRDVTVREGMQRIRQAYDNAAAERQQKVADMWKLRCIERRISTLSAWMMAFEMVESGGGGEVGEDGEAREEAGPTRMAAALVPMHKSARGILAELEHSRQHLHQKVERCNWERAVDTALQHSIGQVKTAVADSAVADAGEAIATLTREAELLKAQFGREALVEVQEQERKTGTGEVMQGLLAAQFRMMAALAETLEMGDEEAGERGPTVMQELLEKGVTAAGQVIRPDVSAEMAATIPLPKRGQPRRKRMSSLGYGGYSSTARPSIGGSSYLGSHLLVAAAGTRPGSGLGLASPSKAAPRRHRVSGAGARKSVSFTPLKKKASSSSLKRSVRWRDDASEDGTLADYEKTPQGERREGEGVRAESRASEARSEESQESQEEASGARRQLAWTMDTVPEEASSPMRRAIPGSPASPALPTPPSLSRMDLLAADESLLVGDTSSMSTSMLASKPSRFQAGFLTKTRLSSAVSAPSVTSIPSAVSSSSLSPPSPDSERTLTLAPLQRRASPLRNISLPRAANHQLTPPSATRIASLNLSGSPKYISTGLSPSSLRDENQPPSQLPRTSSPRTSSPAGHHSDADMTAGLTAGELIDPLKLRSAIPAAAGARLFSIGTHNAHSRRTSSSLPASSASSTNGISRQRRRSNERQRSPPISCSPPRSHGAGTSGIGRLGSSLSGSGSGSLRDGMATRGGLAGPSGLSGASGLSGPSGLSPTRIRHVATISGGGSPQQGSRLLDGTGRRRTTTGNSGLTGPVVGKKEGSGSSSGSGSMSWR
ncbi:kinesin family protein [Grosmannia clavigera kw1407]|uniref:Kinesin family protein n=1 Tax=Grosmannia clavigera (strain kw1407 / UAMH 11150) TaxID=655863 RepID=F0XCK2_GROCL|nr:kinesin family protein [Grosmannia clavigera kw1407]EFX04542.1 kinesin family protein [Grosmannia clavigera kw1407]